MILYLDASAHVKLYVDEDHSEYTRNLVSRVASSEDPDSPDGFSTVAVSNVGYVEVTAALAAIQRDRRITKDERGRALSVLEEDMRTRFTVLNSLEALPVASRLNAGDETEMEVRYRIEDDSEYEGYFSRVEEDSAPISGTYARHRLKGYDTVHLAVCMIQRDRASAESRRKYEVLQRRYVEDRGRLSPQALEERYPPGGPRYPETEAVMLLSYDRRLHASARREGLAHANPALDGGHEFLDIEYDFT